MRKHGSFRMAAGIFTFLSSEPFVSEEQTAPK